MRALPATTESIAVLDRTKEPGGVGEPLYQDVITGLAEKWSRLAPECPLPMVIGGRYGLSSKEFTPAMAEAVFDELKTHDSKRHFTIGITDDVTHLSLAWRSGDWHEPDDVQRAVFYGLGSDGTVGANKNTVKIIGENTSMYAQGYFVYDSKKVGSVTVSHLRFSQQPIKSTYLIERANFVACHQFAFLESRDVLTIAADGATFLLNCPYGPEDVWDELPAEVQQQIIEKHLRFYVVDAASIAGDVGLGRRINTVMQACFFALAEILPVEQAMDEIKHMIRHSYAGQGASVVHRNEQAVDAAHDRSGNIHFEKYW